MRLDEVRVELDGTPVRLDRFGVPARVLLFLPLAEMSLRAISPSLPGQGLGRRNLKKGDEQKEEREYGFSNNHVIHLYLDLLRQRLKAHKRVTPGISSAHEPLIEHSLVHEISAVAGQVHAVVRRG
jgi:hypothetical protein